MTIEEALYAYLTADATLGALLRSPTSVFEYLAPEEAQPPYVVFGLHTGKEIWSFRTFYRTQLWQVKGVCRGPDARPAKAIDRRLEQLLNNAPLEFEEHLLYLRREQDVSYPEDDGGTLVSHRGGLYALLSEPEGS